MKKGKLFSCMVLGLLIIVVLFMIGGKVSEKIEFRQKQEKLAEIMNVSLEDYPNLPDDYFYEKLQLGMTLEEVHKIMIGYEKVYNGYDSDFSAFYEIYAYYSTEEDKAVRIRIIYDENYRVEKIDSEDDNSRFLTTKGWPEGQVTRR